MKKNIYPYCTTKEFKTDISQLCENCPLKIEIPKAIEEQIIFQAKEFYSIDPESILEYIQSELNKAHNSMNLMLIESKKEGAHLDKVSKTYIWNKERIKALNEFKKSVEHKKEPPKELHIDLQETEKVILPKGFPNILNIDKIKGLMNFLIKNELIKEDTKESDFLYWFGCNREKQSIELQPIHWVANKQLARELLTGLYKDKIIVAEIEKLTPICFIYKNTPLKLSKNRAKPDTKSDEIKNYLATLLNS